MPSNLPSIDDLLSEAKENSLRAGLTQKIENIELKRKEELTKKTAEARGIPYMNLVGFAIGPEALKTIPIAVSEKNKIICFLLIEGSARFGVVDSDDPKINEIIEKVKKTYHVNTDIYLISEHSLNQALKIYKQLPTPRIKIKGIDIADSELKKFTANVNNLEDFNKLVQKVNTTDLVTLMVAAAVKLRASDIHLEPRESELNIRFRIDGMLHKIADLDKNRGKHIISRIKLLSAIKLNITSRPQDGRFTIRLPDDKIDVRTASLPTNTGETITMRLLTASIAELHLEKLGLNKEAHRIIQKLIEKPDGMIISTGPTGSGKTTTLYAIMNKLNDGDRKIITIEDPIEYSIPNISQSQVDKKKDYTFAKGLENLVRQDPDILMVGEIRDSETAEIAIQASLTGHLILTTLHTNEAAGAPSRMLSLGSKNELFASALNVAIGQRLVRKLCEHCKKEHALTAEESRLIKDMVESWPKNYAMSLPDINTANFYESVGCSECQGFGFWGRIGIFEIFVATEKIKRAILKSKSADHEIRQIAQEEGMITMLQDGLLKATGGITSLKEIIRVTGSGYVY